jgi:P-type Cu+ transporter
MSRGDHSHHGHHGSTGQATAESPPGTAIDPVCGMSVDKATVGHRHAYGGSTWYFCSKHCLDRFSSEPERYAKGEREPEPMPGAPPGAIYTCPMHPEIRQSGPGHCPKCGMALEPVIASAGDDPNPELIDMTRRFWISLVLTIPVFGLAMAEDLPGLHAVLPDPRLSRWIQFILSVPVVLWAAWPFFVRGWNSLVLRSLNMYTLIALGTGAAFAYSATAVLAPGAFPPEIGGAGHAGVYFEAAAVITVLVILGEVLQLRARESTGNAVRALLKLAPNTAIRVVQGGDDEVVPLDHVKAGDRLRVRPGDRIPVDGEVLEGRSTVDEALVTGESMPVEKTVGHKAIAGTINGSGSFVMSADRVGADTLLAQIVQMVAEAQRTRAPIQRLADVVSSFFVPAVVAIAAAAFVVWSLYGPPPATTFALVVAVSVLIIACPCALGLATPMSIMVGTGRGAQAGVLIRSAEALERMERVDTLVVDKTGTLTEGRPELTTVAAAEGFTEAHVLQVAASLERGSEHPLAAAILAGARGRGGRAQPVENFESVTGSGVHATLEGRSVALGSFRFAESLAAVPAIWKERADTLRKKGETVMFLVDAGRFAGLIGVADPIKASAHEALRALESEGIRVIMLTGDNELTARAVAGRLGIREVRADVLPQEKGAVVKALRAEGRVVAMAGDGVNDAPALAQADVGIAMGTGAEVAIQSAGITLVKGDLRGIVRSRRLSRATMRNVRENLFLAFVYNAVGVPIAAGVLFPWTGLLLNPMIAAAAMSASSVSVVVNALRLRSAAF